MKYRTIKYCLLTFFGLLTIERYINFGDYCTGMPDGLAWIFFWFIFLIALLIYIGIDIYKKKFDKYVLIILFLFLGLNVSLTPIIEFVSTRNIYLNGNIEKDNSRDKHIQLYKDNRFKLDIKYVEWTCFFKGEYLIKQDSLILIKERLIQDTDSSFTYKYKIDLKNKILIPSIEFDTIKITRIND